MKRQLIINTIIGLSLLAVGLYVARNTYWDWDEVRVPPGEEAQLDPYYATRHFLGSLGIHTTRRTSLRELPPVDRAMLVSELDSEWQQEHLPALKQWVERGGRLVVPYAEVSRDRQLQDWSGLHPAPPLATDSDEDEEDGAKAPKRRHDPCPTLQVHRDGQPTGESRRVCIGEFAGFISQRTPAWALVLEERPRALRVRVGRGSLTVLNCDCLFVNERLPMHDHARVLVESVDLRVGDELQILDPGKATPILNLLWQLAAPALLLAALALILLIWRQLPRFGPPEPVAAPLRRSLAEQLRAQADFSWRTRHLAALRKVMHRALESGARQRIAGFAQLAPMDRAAAIAIRSGLPSQALREAMNDATDGEAEAQRNAIELMERARRSLEAG